MTYTGLPGEHDEVAAAACRRKSRGSHDGAWEHCRQPCTPMSMSASPPSASASPQTVWSKSSKKAEEEALSQSALLYLGNEERNHKEINHTGTPKGAPISTIWWRSSPRIGDTSRCDQDRKGNPEETESK